MGRLIVVLILGLIAWWLIRKFLKDRSDELPRSADARKVEDMVSCARCGVNLPKSEAREESGRYFCVGNPQCLPRP